MAILHDFLTAPTTLGVFALILADLVTGVLSAWRRGEFSWARLADVLCGPTARHIGGYAAWWLVSRGGVEVGLAAYVGTAAAAAIGVTLASAGAGFSALALWASIQSNVREIQSPTPPIPPITVAAQGVPTDPTHTDHPPQARS